MLLDRQAEVKIIIAHLESEKLELIETLAKMRIWASIANIDSNIFEPNFNIKENIDKLDEMINSYKNLLV